MQIERDMDLRDLRDEMGGCATEEDARRMRDELVDRHGGRDTRHVGDHDWDGMSRGVSGWLSGHDCWGLRTRNGR